MSKHEAPCDFTLPLKSPRQGFYLTCLCRQDGLGNDDSGLPSVVLPGTPLSEPGTPLWLGQRQPTAMQEGTAGMHRYQHSSPTPSPLRCCQPATAQQHGCTTAWLRLLVLQHMSGLHGLPACLVLVKVDASSRYWVPPWLASPGLRGCGSPAHALGVRRSPHAYVPGCSRHVLTHHQHSSLPTPRLMPPGQSLVLAEHGQRPYLLETSPCIERLASHLRCM